MKSKIIIYLGLFPIVLLSCTSKSNQKSTASTARISILLNGIQNDSNQVVLQINDAFGDAFYKKKSMHSGVDHSFDYQCYRPIIAQLRINDKANNILLEPDKQQYTYRIDSLGYLYHTDLYHEYINSLSYLSDHNCNHASSLQEAILCIDRFSNRKQQLLDSYKQKGMEEKLTSRAQSELYYNRYKLYASLALYRRGYIEIEEDNSIVYDSISAMDMNYGTYENSINRAQALVYQSLLNRQIGDDVKKYNYLNLRELFHNHKNDVMVSTRILAALHDNPYRDQSLIDSLMQRSNPTFVESLLVNKKVGATYAYSEEFWTDIDGSFIEKESLKPKVSLVNFWFPGCKPCIASIPQKNELVAHYKTHDNFQLVNVSCDFSRSIWTEYLDRYEMHGRHFFVPEQLQDQHDNYYELSQFPTYMLVVGEQVERIEQYPISSKELYRLIDHALGDVTAVAK